VHDFDRRFLNRTAPERHYVLMGRIVTALLMVLAGSFTFVLDTARTTFDLLLSVGAGTGLIYLLRWFWWRINAWSEISAMVSSLLVAVAFFVAGKMGHPVPGYASLIGTVAVTTVVWLIVTFATDPVEHATLLSFYRLVRPAGPGWSRIRAEAGGEPSPDNLPNALLGWVLGCVMVYAALFGVGSLLYGATAQGYTLLAICLVSALGLARLIPRLWPHSGH
jgi:Na+/proline symporter